MKQLITILILAFSLSASSQDIKIITVQPSHKVMLYDSIISTHSKYPKAVDRMHMEIVKLKNKDVRVVSPDTHGDVVIESYDNSATVIENSWETNTKETALTNDKLNAKDYVKDADFRIIYISTKGKKRFPEVENSTFILGSPFEVNQTYYLNILLTENGSYSHFFIKKYL